MLSFHPPPQLTSCTSATFSWSYSGPDDPMLLQITNVGVSQNPPPLTIISPIATTRNLPRSTSAIPIGPMDLTVPLVTNYDPSLLSYVWNTVTVAEGWFMLLATIRTDPLSQISQASSPFFVRTGTNMSCLGIPGIISATNTPTKTPTITPSSSLSFNTSRPVTSIPASDLSTSTSRVPTIVGVSVGMAVLAIGSLIVWFILMRKGRSRTSDGNNKNNFQRWKGLNDSRGFDANAPNKRYHSSRSHLTSQPASIVSTLGPEYEDGILLGAEKGSDEQGVALSTLPVLHHQSSRTRPDHTYSASSSTSNVNDFGKPSARYSNQHSIDSSPVYPPSFTFSPRESGQYIPPDVSRSYSLNTTGTHYSLPNSIDQTSSSPISPLSSSSFPPPPSIASRETKQTNRQSIGKKRKPAPVYDPLEVEPTSSTSSAMFTIPPLPYSTSTESTFPELSHKSSFGPYGIEGKQLHYLIPDMPLSHNS